MPDCRYWEPITPCSRSGQVATVKAGDDWASGPLRLFEYGFPRDVLLLRAATLRDRSRPSTVLHGLLLIPLATLEQAWREFFFTPEPAVTVAVFRILFGLILVVHGLLLWPHANLWYGPKGFLPYKNYCQIYGRSRFSVF